MNALALLVATAVAVARAHKGGGGNVHSMPTDAALKEFAMAASEEFAEAFAEGLASHNFRRSRKGRGTGPIEALLISSITTARRATAYVESGRAPGEGMLQVASAMHSMRAKLGLPPIEYHSCDWSGSRTHSASDDRKARERVRSIPNITFHNGNSMVLVPELLRTLGEQGHKRVVVYIDGPKGYASVSLLRQAVAHRHVLAAIESDAGHGWDSRALLDNLVITAASDLNRERWPCRTVTFTSDDPDYMHRFEYVNKRFVFDDGGDDVSWAYVTSPSLHCCKYAPPAPCYGNITYHASIVVIMRTAHPSADNEVKCFDRASYAAPRCMKASGRPVWTGGCMPSATNKLCRYP